MGKLTSDGLYNDLSLNNLKKGEPFFVMSARCPHAPWVVRQWAARAQESGTPQSTIDDALALAVEMEEWARTNKQAGLHSPEVIGSHHGDQSEA